MQHHLPAARRPLAPPRRRGARGRGGGRGRHRDGARNLCCDRQEGCLRKWQGRRRGLQSALRLSPTKVARCCVCLQDLFSTACCSGLTRPSSSAWRREGACGQLVLLERRGYSSIAGCEEMFSCLLPRGGSASCLCLGGFAACRVLHSLHSTQSVKTHGNAKRESLPAEMTIGMHIPGRSLFTGKVPSNRRWRTGVCAATQPRRACDVRGALSGRAACTASALSSRPSSRCAPACQALFGPCRQTAAM